jgi:serine/threonine-protein kinase
MDLTRGEAPPAASSGSVLAAAEAEREMRGVIVCDAASSRVTQGATLGPSDVEGWVVELAFVRPGPAGDFALDPQFAELFRRRASGLQLFASEASGWGENTLRDVTAVSHPPAPATKLWELRVVLDGHAVDQYFREEGRSRFYRLAAQLADRLGATHGGVFARCASRTTPHLGSWFRGPDDAGAAAALLYFLGTSREAPHVPLPLLNANDRGTLFEALARASANLDRKQLARWIGRHDGSISGGKHTPVVVTFPYKDGGRGERASQDLARATHLVRDAL